MIHRTLSIGIVAFWVTMMGLLVWREVLPKLTAGEPPKPPPTASLPAFSTPRRSQAGVFDAKGRRIGTARSTTQQLPDATVVKSSLALDRLGMIPRPLRIDSTLRFEHTGKLADVRIDVAEPVRVVITGATVGLDFSINVKAEGIERTIVLDARAASHLAQPQDPLAVLGELRVGARWRVHQIDPLASLFGQKIHPRLVLVEVVAKEGIEVDGRRTECYRVRIGPDILAWVAPDGEVVRQEGYLPLIGKAIWQSETYNEDDVSARRPLAAPQ